MPKKELTLLQSALQRLRVSRMGPLTVLIVDGQGMALTLTGDFAPIEKWAMSKTAGPNGMIDMGKILDKVEVCITRPGTTFASTRGSLKPLESLVKAMKAAGLDTKEFQLPPELKDGYLSPEAIEKKRKAEKEKAEARKLAEEQAQHNGEGTL